MKKAKNFDEYIKSQTPQAKTVIKQLRQTIKKAAPEAEDVISYGMPAFKFHGMLLYYAAFKDHYSLFPFSGSIEAFKDKLKAYETSKGTIKFLYEKPLPVKLITAIVKYRVQENRDKAELKKMMKGKKTEK